VHKLKVPDKALKTPMLCCCCGGKQINSNYVVTTSRQTTTTEEIVTESSRLEFPICQKCLDWMQTETLAQALSQLAWMLPFIFIMTIVLGLVFIFQDPSGGSFLILFLGLLLLPLTYPLYKWFKKIEAESKSTKPHPQCSLTPVVYIKWDGFNHLLGFSNSLYFDRLVEVITNQNL
jgi:hypothetical protein